MTFKIASTILAGNPTAASTNADAAKAAATAATQTANTANLPT